MKRVIELLNNYLKKCFLTPNTKSINDVIVKEKAVHTEVEQISDTTFPTADKKRSNIEFHLNYSMEKKMIKCREARRQLEDSILVKSLAYIIYTAQ